MHASTTVCCSRGKNADFACLMCRRFQPKISLTRLMQMQGALGLVAEYDMYGAKLGSSEIVVAPICLAYSKDGSLLIAVLKVPPRTFCRNFIGSPTDAAGTSPWPTEDCSKALLPHCRTAVSHAGTHHPGAARFSYPASLAGVIRRCSMLIWRYLGYAQIA